jgi:molybdopterin molybdotransferase
MKKEEMIDYDEALGVILEHTPGPTGQEEVPLARAVGRILSREVVSDVNLPPFNRSAMDGFAVRAADLTEPPVTLDVVFDVPAGSAPESAIGPGQAASVMTGAPVPEGADTVIQVEWTSGFGEDRVVVNRAGDAGMHISPRGEILGLDQPVLGPGVEIGVEEVGLLAAVGCDRVPVFTRPTAAVLSTGDELVPPGEKPGPSQIRDCNGPSLLAFLAARGLEAVDLGRAPDDLEATRALIEKGLESDCLLVSGGVSAGAYDFVQDVLGEFGIEVHTRRLAVKPGKPTIFGTREGKVVFGLPGNPVSTSVITRVLVGPALDKMSGLGRPGPRIVKARLLGGIKKKPDRLWFVHGNLEHGADLAVAPVENHGSADLPSASRGSCLIIAPRGTRLVEAGSTVDVIVWERSV